MYYGIVKTLHSVAYVALIWLTWQWWHGQTDLSFEAGRLLLSGLWLGLTFERHRKLFTTIFDPYSKLAVSVPAFMGVFLSGAAIVHAHYLAGQIIGGALLLGWIGLYAQYRMAKAKFVKAGHGDLPEGTWVCPPPEALQPGDLILTNGRAATVATGSVGHGETVIRAPDGSMFTLSSYMQTGCQITPLAKVANPEAQQGLYIAMRLQKPLDARLIALDFEIAHVMLEENIRWRDRKQAARDRLFAKLGHVLPKSWTAFLASKLKVTGYDWFGLVSGRVPESHWTCIVACQELYRRIGIETKRFGTGFFGMGTGLLDPLLPVRMLADPAFRLLTVDDQKAFVSKRS